MSTETLLFWVFAVATLISASVVILSRNPINSAMALVGTFFFLAGIYVLLWAHTIAVLQVLVYAGAIMVLFLFVIMLLSLTDANLGTTKVTPTRVVGGASAAGLMAVVTYALLKMPGGSQPISNPETFGTLGQLGKVLYTTYLLPFEAVSLLLLVAIVGAVVVAKSRI
ncbi:MAG: NADH-quinone oxidoreductase subunit J family protein [Myxococcaceae bacterium]